jgi:butyrate kinase
MKVLVINPGSTSTKVALFQRESELWRKSVSHPVEERFPTLDAQLHTRRQTVLRALREESGFVPAEVAAVIGRGGLLHPLAGGVYRVNQEMKEDLAQCRYGTHASNLGGLLADLLAAEMGAGVPAFIADPVVVDELDALARYSGLPDLPRRSIFHALNQKASARRAARELGKRYEDCSLIVAHLGGGVSVGVHLGGRVRDVNNALDGDGPFAVERAGGLPSGDWLRYVLAHREEPEALQRRLTGRGGVVAYLGTNDAHRIEEAIAAHERGEAAPEGLDGRRCLEVLQAMCYRIAKEICSLAAAASGKLDAVVLTGGLAHSARIVEGIAARVGFLAPLLVYPGENEMEALAAAACDALEGRLPIQEYRR